MCWIRFGRSLGWRAGGGYGYGHGYGYGYGYGDVHVHVHGYGHGYGYGYGMRSSGFRSGYNASAGWAAPLRGGSLARASLLAGLAIWPPPRAGARPPHHRPGPQRSGVLGLGRRDAAAAWDSGFVDAGQLDAGFGSDAGFADAGFADAGFADAGFASDAEVTDTGTVADAGFAADADQSLDAAELDASVSGEDGGFVGDACLVPPALVDGPFAGGTAPRPPTSS